jgi:DNA-binding XRE family transcriptional regulator
MRYNEKLQAHWEKRRAQLRRLLALGYTQAEIARKMGVRRQAVNQMIARMK